jgi:hypothetical protein
LGTSFPGLRRSMIGATDLSDLAIVDGCRDCQMQSVKTVFFFKKNTKDENTKMKNKKKRVVIVVTDTKLRPQQSAHVRMKVSCRPACTGANASQINIVPS